MSSEYPLINGRRHSFASVQLTLNGKRFAGVASVSYSDSVEPGTVRGTSSQPLGFTRGDYSAEASVALYLEEAAEFEAELGNGIYDKVFDMTVVYADDGAPTIQDDVIGCRITSISNDNQSGTDGSQKEYELLPHYIRRDGRDPFERMLSGAA